MHIRWKGCLLFLIATVLSFIMTFAVIKPDFWRQYSKFGDEDIRITATGEKNTNSQFSQITIRYIYVDGRFLSPADYVVEGKWDDSLNELTWVPNNSDITNYIQLRIPPGRNRKFYFSKSIYRGYAQIDSRGSQYKVDFYNNGDINDAIDLSGYQNYSNTILFVLKSLFLVAVTLIIFCILKITDKLLLKYFKSYNSLDFICTLFLLFVTLLCTFEHTDGPWSHSIPWTDSDVFIYFGWAMGKGKVPYLDMFDHKGLYFYFLEYLGYTLTKSAIGIWLIEFVALYISLLFSYFLVRKYENSIISIIITVLGYSYAVYYLALGNYIETYTIPFISVSIYIFHSYFYKQRFHMGNISTFVLGILFFCTLMMRQNSVAVWPIVCLFIVLHQIYLKKPLEIFRYAIVFMLGILVAAIPAILYLSVHNAWRYFFEDFWLFNFSYVEGGGSKLEAFKNFGINIICVIIYIGMFFSIVNYKKIIKNFFMIVCFSVAFGVNMLFVCMSGYIWSHYGALLLPFCPIGLLLFEKNIRIFIKDSTVKIFPMILCYIAGICTMFLIVDKKNVVWSVLNAGGSVIYNPNSSNTMKAICRRIRQNTEEDDTITVLGNTCNFYWYSGRLSASKFIYQDPLFRVNSDIAKEYVSDIKKNMPAAIVIPNRTQFEEFGYLYNEINDIIIDSYHIEFSQDGQELYILNK